MPGYSVGNEVMTVRKENRATPLDPGSNLRSVYHGMRSLHRIEVFEKLRTLATNEMRFEAWVDRRPACSGDYLDDVIQGAREIADKIDIAKRTSIT